MSKIGKTVPSHFEFPFISVFTNIKKASKAY